MPVVPVHPQPEPLAGTQYTFEWPPTGNISALIRFPENAVGLQTLPETLYPQWWTNLGPITPAKENAVTVAITQELLHPIEVKTRDTSSPLDTSANQNLVRYDREDPLFYL